MNSGTNIICQALGHRFETPAFYANTLHYCQRCGEELLGRTIDDIDYATDDDIDQVIDAGEIEQHQSPTPNYIWGAIALIVICLALWLVNDDIPEAKLTIDPLPRPATIDCPSDYVCATPSYISID